MLLIGLVGGTSATRNKIVNKIISLRPNQVSHWRLPEHMSSKDRVAMLERLFKPSAHGRRVMVIEGVNTVDEANWITGFNGFILHVNGSISSTVPFKDSNHYFVSEAREIKSPWFSVEEVLSECQLVLDQWYDQHYKKYSVNRDKKRIAYLEGLSQCKS